MFRPLLETTEEKNLPWSLRHGNPHDIAPRIGFAWRPFGSSKWVIRSAYGIFYVYPDSNILLGQVRTPPFVILQVINNDVPTATTLVPSRNLANYFLGQSLLDINATPAPSTGGTDYATTYTQTWNFNVQREFAHNIAVEAGYVGNKGTHLQTFFGAKRPVARAGQCAGAPSLPAVGCARLQDLGRVQHLSQPAGQVRKALLGRVLVPRLLLVLQMSRRARQRRGQLLRPTISTTCTRVRCDYDVPHNFVTSYIWELPFGKGRRFLGIGAEGALTS